MLLMKVVTSSGTAMVDARELTRRAVGTGENEEAVENKVCAERKARRASFIVVPIDIPQQPLQDF